VFPNFHVNIEDKPLGARKKDTRKNIRDSCRGDMEACSEVRKTLKHGITVKMRCTPAEGKT
jgi:hypothetical protein